MTYLNLAGVQVTAEIKKAVEIGLKEIRKEKYAERLKRRS